MEMNKVGGMVMSLHDNKYSLKLDASLDKDFIPAIIWIREYLFEVLKTNDFDEVIIGIEKSAKEQYVYKTVVFAEKHQKFNQTCFYLERLIKTLLWLKGGYSIKINAPAKIVEFVKTTFSKTGRRSFDVNFMERIYEQGFQVNMAKASDIIEVLEETQAIGKNLKGCRVGFDAGGSDLKVSAVIDGKSVFSTEVIWFPKLNSDPDYHYEEILKVMRLAAEKMPRVDAIGISSAGVYIDNKTMAASLFIKVPDNLFTEKVKDIYIRAGKEFGDIPITVCNDGDVTALAGSMSLSENNVLGIAMGTAEAAGYIDEHGHITGWLNELSFVPVDFNENSIIDEWSGDFGVGCKYFSQDSVIKLAVKAGLVLDESLSLAEKLAFIQEKVKNGNKMALEVFKNIGIYMGYTLPFYDLFYNLKNVLILGRVTSGQGGRLIVKYAKKVLKSEFPELYGRINLILPDEKSRRVGQSIAAASLPNITINK